MRNWLSTYFNFSKREFNGLIAMILLVIVITVIPYIYKRLIFKPEDLNADMLQVKRLKLPIKRTTDYRKIKRNISRRKIRYSPFYFDPNVTSVPDWQRLGLSLKQSAAIVKYVAKGGRFKAPEDLQRMYTINAETYRKLLPYVRIKNALKKNSADVKRNMPYVGNIPAKRKVIEVNSADSIALVEIKGIGPSFARRIIRYRERIGGFYNKDQLLEVFGLDSAKFNEIKDQVIINSGLLKKININTMEWKDLKDHPYIRYKQINAIVEYRKQHGNYANIADLNKVANLTPDVIDRLAPYLIF